MSSCSEKLLINCVHADPGGCMCIIYLLHSKCDTYSLLANIHDPENRSQKLNEIHRRKFSHWNCYTDSLAFFGQIPSLSPGLSYDKQCYQWFSGKLNCFMDTYLFSSAGQDTEATHSVANWPLSNRFMPNPDCMFCHSDVRKSRKHIIGQ